MPPFHVVIPARRRSTRLPDKPLLDVAGKPLIVRVLERVRDCGAAQVIVATDDAAIAEVVRAHGGGALMTRPDHASGTDRLAEVAEQLGWPDETILVNVQGDEPLIPPALVAQLAQALDENKALAIATAAAPVTSSEEWFDPNAVKVVCNAAGEALYFSRAPIPWARDALAANDRPAVPPVAVWRHIGIYAYRVRFLRRFVSWPVAPIEAAEALEQLRALWHGERIRVLTLDKAPPAGVDTPEDLARVRAWFAHSSFF